MKKNNINIIIILLIIIVIGLIGYLVYSNTRPMEEEKKEEQEIVEEETYSAGEKVTLVDGSSWYVISQNDTNITLLSTENYGEQTYFSESTNYYENSLVKSTIENSYLPTLKSSLEQNGGDTKSLSARIISVEEIRKILGTSESVDNGDIEIEKEYSWLFETGTYWTSTHSSNELYESVYIVQSWLSFAVVKEDLGGLGLTSGNKYYIRPVIETTISNIK